MVKCEAKGELCENEAEYVFQDLNSCRECIEHYIREEIFDVVVESYLELNATKL